jgi:hypothetical protein
LAELQEVAKAAMVYQTECLVGPNEITGPHNITNITYLVFANDKFDNIIPQLHIGKCGALNLMGDDTVKRGLAEAKDEQDKLHERCVLTSPNPMQLVHRIGHEDVDQLQVPYSICNTSQCDSVMTWHTNYYIFSLFFFFHLVTC